MIAAILERPSSAHDEVNVLGSHQVEVRRMHGGQAQPGTHRFVGAFLRPLYLQSLDVNIYGRGALNARRALRSQGIARWPAKVQYVAAMGQEGAKLSSLQSPNLRMVLGYCEDRGPGIPAE